MRSFCRPSFLVSLIRVAQNILEIKDINTKLAYPRWIFYKHHNSEQGVRFKFHFCQLSLIENWNVLMKIKMKK